MVGNPPWALRIQPWPMPPSAKQRGGIFCFDRGLGGRCTRSRQTSKTARDRSIHRLVPRGCQRRGRLRMRLLAYGGNASKERRRFGEWDIPEPILQSGYGIGTPNRRSYGCGILQKQPYLIFRELQGTERGGYPFTLLMDPGEEIWRRWQWDAAELIAAILQSEECGVLFREPERLEEESGRQLFSGLSRRESSEKRPLNQDQLSVWIGACAAEQAVIVLPPLFGFVSAPP